MRMLTAAQYVTLILAAILKKNSGELIVLTFEFLLQTLFLLSHFLQCLLLLNYC